MTRRKTADPGQTIMEGVDDGLSVNDPLGGDPTVYTPSGGRVTVATEHVGIVLAHYPDASVAVEDPSVSTGSGEPPA